jgi:hypothetical protein
MKQHLVFLLLLTASSNIYAQNVGIGTNNPLRKLSVTGSVMVDQGNTNTGDLDSAALVFGSAGHSGISSLKLGANAHDLRFWTSGFTAMNLSPIGNLTVGSGSTSTWRLWVRSGDAAFDGRIQASGSVSVGGALDNKYRLRVYDGSARIGGDFHATGYTAVGGEVDSTYRFRVWDGNSRFGGNLYATGNVAFGGSVDDNYRLRVHSGNSHFGGDVQVNGALDATTVEAFNLIGTHAQVSSLSINGNGSVRSNGASSLRIGFDQKTVNAAIAPHGGVTVTANITDFSGDNDDVRVMVTQVVPGGGNTLFIDALKIQVLSVNAADDTVDLRITNLSDFNATASFTIYLTSIAKN